jgi:hypothetical protein
MDNSSTCDSPIARTANGSTSAGSMNSSMQNGFASASTSASAPTQDSTALMTFAQPPSNDPMLFEFDDFTQYLTFHDPHDASLNDVGGGMSSLQVVSSCR